MIVLAQVAPLGHESIGDDHSRLKALLDSEFLVGAGWDWQTMVLSPPADHPTLGWPVCQVPGCEGMVEGGKGVCAACALRIPQRQRRAARFVREDLHGRRRSLRRGLRQALGIATATVVRRS
jgi:hypothetical protein